MRFDGDYVAWDLETTGLDWQFDKILEIGAMRVSPEGGIVERRSWMLRHPAVKIQPKITEITGITQEMMMAEGIDAKQAIDEFVQWQFDACGWRNLTHNGFRFDIPFLLEAIVSDSTYNYAERDDFKRKLYTNGYDSAVLYKASRLGKSQAEGEGFPHFARRILDERVFGLKYNVAHCCKELGIDASGVVMHRAMGDVELTNRIFVALHERTKTA